MLRETDWEAFDYNECAAALQLIQGAEVAFFDGVVGAGREEAGSLRNLMA